MTAELGFGMDEMMTAIEVHQLQDDNKFKALQKIAMASKEKEEKEFIGMCKPDSATEVEFLNKAKAFGAPAYKADGTMTFDYFLLTKIHSLDFSIKHHTERFNQMKADRSVLLAGQKNPKEPNEAYFLALIKKVAMQTITERMYDGILYNSLKVPEKAYGLSLQTYLMDPEKRKVYEEETEKTREKHNTHKPCEMDKAAVLDCAKRLEEFKFAAQQKMYMIVRQQKMPSEMINSIIIFEKDRADD